MKPFRLLIVLVILAATVACSEKGDKYAFQYVSFKETLPYHHSRLTVPIPFLPMPLTWTYPTSFLTSAPPMYAVP